MAPKIIHQSVSQSINQWSENEMTFSLKSANMRKRSFIFEKVERKTVTKPVFLNVSLSNYDRNKLDETSTNLDEVFFSSFMLSN